MKRKIVLTFGCLSGLVSSAMMFGSLPFLETIGFNKGLVVGYTAIVLSFLFVFFGVRRYRESLNGERLTFLNAFAVGLMITLISCVFYVVSWEILSVNFMPDFVDKYSAQVLQELRASGASEAAIEAKTREMADFKVMYANPFMKAAFTFIEPFPVGLAISLISAFALRTRSVLADARAHGG
jgi:hypothetical protein